VEYDSVRLALRESTGATVTVTGYGPIGVHLAGLWDEVVVSNGEIAEDDPFADECWNSIRSRLSEDPPESGSPDRNRRSFETLRITLIDGCELRVVAGRFDAVRSHAG
jgi:hypothetical protein